ncbi:hypothetical protein AgCh_025439 [Apium graveolens]
MTLMKMMRMKNLEIMHLWLLSNENHPHQNQSEIEVVLREKLEKNEVKLKSFRNASQLVGQYQEKNKPYANIAIGLDYDALNSNKKMKAREVNLSEVELVIKQELADEDSEKKNEETTHIAEIKKKPMANQVSKTLIKEIKTENAGKKKKNRNGKIGVNKSNNFAFVVDAPRKQCHKCGQTNHLTHLYKKAISEPKVEACKYNKAKAEDPFSFRDKFDCIP